MAKTPKIRFKNFSDEWEVRKLGEIANYRRGSFPQPYGKSEWYDGEEAKPFIQVADITDSMNLVSDTKQKISKLAQPMSVFAEKGSVLVTLQGSIGRVAITQYGAFVDRTVLIFEKYKIDIDNLFWAYIIKQKFIKEARKAPGGTIKTITKEALSDFDLLLSNYNEQQKIGAFFSKLDKLIALHQSKFEKLQKIKKSCLQNLFPQNNQNTPKIRFKNFSDEWNSEILEKFCNIYDGTHQTPNYTNKGVMFLSVEDIKTLKSNKFISKIEFEKNYKIFPTYGDILLTRIGDIGVANVFLSFEKVAYYVSLALLKPKNVNSFFLQNSFSSDYLKNELFKRTLHIAFPKKINKNEIGKMQFKIPKNIKEQEKIGAFFSKLDKLIALHQSKFEKLQKIKKSCLQNMFV
ncbi:restriction endonuclease subunit S [Campylobacter sp.]|uniref:restriction endonuclease subunit S n=1 Tax=Campylobacter sp. TaxID=205 RepID=UPI00259CC3E3|nr:restriction endonuclease subunit S [Campylobacter sp.]MBQ7135238.1 restriction endonuclease subunit S [Campylobacter sp.]